MSCMINFIKWQTFLSKISYRCSTTTTLCWCCPPRGAYRNLSFWYIVRNCNEGFRNWFQGDITIFTEIRAKRLGGGGGVDIDPLLPGIGLMLNILGSYSITKLYEESFQKSKILLKFLLIMLTNFFANVFGLL